MLGQMIVARFSGPHPSTAFLARIRAGQIGGVILFADNLSGGPQATRALTGELQQAASAGGNPPLLITTDQEGGSVRRLYWAPPTLAASAMSSSAVARSEGEAAGRALRSAGINVDLAPVADVLRVPESFLGTRAFGSDPLVVAARACAFASGLTAAGVGFTLKHFPGLGRAEADTDTQPVTVDAPASALRADYRAYRDCGAQPDALVMVSSASYPSLTGSSLPAVLSPEIYREELPDAIGGQPVTISDDLQTPGILDQLHPARQAINAGLDLLMYAQTEAGSSSAYSQLLALVRAHGISHTRISEAYEAVQAFKQLLLTGATTASTGGEASEATEGNGSGAVQAAPTTNPGTPTTISPSGRSEAG
jgi:beta-N-acetylhexosaminidase